LFSGIKIGTKKSEIDDHLPTEINAIDSFSDTASNIENYKKIIFKSLKDNFGVDFSHYKESTINRRIQRRMVITEKDNLKHYTEYLLTKPSEIREIFDSILIGVTSFFREPGTLSVLEQKVFPSITRDIHAGESVCVWVPGCSTGEEVYSIAILMREFLANHNKKLTFQILGTDINAKNIQHAKDGLYCKEIESTIGKEILNKYFEEKNNQYRVCRQIREVCTFTKQNLTEKLFSDDWNIVSCRNVLIYFDLNLQEQVLQILYSAIAKQGFLLLGEAESLGKLAYLFDRIEPNVPVFKKRQV
jgi:two-component system, chemotaxis family, CheB/CheR fusion protein